MISFFVVCSGIIIGNINLLKHNHVTFTFTLAALNRRIT